MKTEPNNSEKWYETMTVKMILLGIMALAFLIPLQLIRMVIQEREASSESVKTEISQQWGGEQTVAGPALNIPVYRIITGDDKKQEHIRYIWHIMPETLDIDGNISPEIRSRGIYQSVIYTSSMHLSGSFKLPLELGGDNYNILWDEAYITMGISDNRGITGNVAISIGGRTIEAEPGLTDRELFDSGLSFPLGAVSPGAEIEYNIFMNLRGSQGLSFSPSGKNTLVKLKSEWNAPSFRGNFLPAERELAEDGFSAMWEITHLNRNFPQEWLGSSHDISENTFGVDLILEVDHYQKSERSAKYGLLFIAFTFMVLLFIELTSDKRIHIFSYFLVSLALILFFSLLNSLSEHTGFTIAYIIAALATISLISLFSGKLLGEKRAPLIVGGMLSALYLFLFVLLALNEYAYLAGNIGLFIGLAVTMWLSSKTSLFRSNSL